jgi:hypothetical protein
MNAFCTYCSAEKSKEPGKLPAIRRYKSSRIEQVYAAASLLRLGFYILSGKFGLLSPEHPIEWYDQLLVSSQVGDMVDKLAKQIEELGVTGITYFTKPLASDPKVRPYHDALAAACSRTSRPFSVVELDLGD